MAIKIVTDSTAYINERYLEEYDIKVVSLNVTMDEESRRELDINNESFYSEMDRASEIPKSAQPSPKEFLDAFKDIVKKGDSIVGIFLSSKMSGTYSTANMIKEMTLEEYPNANIEILDSKTNCMQMGFAVIEAAKMAKNNESMEAVISKALEVLEKSKFLFTPETLDYLKKGGRIGTAGALFGNLLKIKPILTVVNGETSVFKKVRTRKKSIDEIVSVALTNIEEKGFGGIIVHHINCEEEGLNLAKALEEKLNRKVEIQSIGPVIGLHVGPGSIGIAYYTK